MNPGQGSQYIRQNEARVQPGRQEIGTESVLILAIVGRQIDQLPATHRGADSKQAREQAAGKRGQRGGEFDDIGFGTAA